MQEILLVYWLGADTNLALFIIELHVASHDDPWLDWLLYHPLKEPRAITGSLACCLLSNKWRLELFAAKQMRTEPHLCSGLFPSVRYLSSNKWWLELFAVKQMSTEPSLMLWLLIPIGTFPLDQTVMAQAKCWRIENYSGWFRILYKSLCCNAVLTFILLHRQARDVCLRLE